MYDADEDNLTEYSERNIDEGFLFNEDSTTTKHGISPEDGDNFEAVEVLSAMSEVRDQHPDTPVTDKKTSMVVITYGGRDNSRLWAANNTKWNVGAVG
jgi:hypothetical protein